MVFLYIMPLIIILSALSISYIKLAKTIKLSFSYPVTNKKKLEYCLKSDT